MDLGFKQQIIYIFISYICVDRNCLNPLKLVSYVIMFSEPCRYEKGPWSECDPKNNMRTRTLTLKDRKKGDATTTAANCEPTKTIQKKCKKGKKGWSTHSLINVHSWNVCTVDLECKSVVVSVFLTRLLFCMECWIKHII